MIHIMAALITSKWINGNVIKKEYINAYLYGCELLISEFISTAILLIIGIVMNKIIETILFMMVFSRIRTVSGGYHASSYRNCITIFCISSFFLLFLTNWLVGQGIYIWIFLCLVIADILVVQLAPVENHNRPLSDDDKKKFRKICIFRMFKMNIIVILVYVFLPFWVDKLMYICTALCYSAILMPVGLLTERKFRSEII